MQYIAKKLALALAQNSIEITIDHLSDDAVYLTVKRDKQAYELFILDYDHAILTQTYFNMENEIDERVLLEEEDFEIETLAINIASVMDHEYLMSLENDEKLQ